MTTRIFEVVVHFKQDDEEKTYTHSAPSDVTARNACAKAAVRDINREIKRADREEGEGFHTPLLTEKDIAYCETRLLAEA